ncbi:MFP1 attachment factor 1 [Cicer arietinum]|uniref:MFP1 attachment factor 1 n=1 Tax=Cicer arietinum TaxID=3827 RepID=A0A1S2Y9L8_CICAR|nr:MFP1 attachment factor 1 [Cicer arietinum]
MSDPEIAPEPQPEQNSASPPQQNGDQPKLIPGGFSIWPPTQRTRDAVINRLIETLTTPSVLSKRYGTLPPDEASAAARQIEDEAYSIAGDSAAPDGGDGIEILQVYSKEISKRMLETVKARPTIGSTAVDNGAVEAPPSDDPPSSSPTTEDAPDTGKIETETDT